MPAVTKIEAVVHSFVHGDVVPNSWVLVQAVQPSGGSYHPPLVHDAHPFIGLRQEYYSSSLLTMCGTVWFSAFAARVTWLLTSPRSSLLVGQSTVLNKDVCHGCGTAGPTTL